MNKILLLALVCLLGSCIDAEYFETPIITDVSGEFDYLSSSDYYDDQDIKYHTGQNNGILALSLDAELIAVTPYLGWEYQIDISDIEMHV